MKFSKVWVDLSRKIFLRSSSSSATLRTCLQTQFLFRKSYADPKSSDSSGDILPSMLEGGWSLLGIRSLILRLRYDCSSADSECISISV